MEQQLRVDHACSPRRPLSTREIRPHGTHPLAVRPRYSTVNLFVTAEYRECPVTRQADVQCAQPCRGIPRLAAAREIGTDAHCDATSTTNIARRTSDAAHAASVRCMHCTMHARWWRCARPKLPSTSSRLCSRSLHSCLRRSCHLRSSRSRRTETCVRSAKSR